MSTDLSLRSRSSARTVVVQREPGAPLELRPRRRRDDVLARLLSSWLDARIARGVAPESGPLLAARAEQLVEPAARDGLAEAWDLLLERASRPRSGVDPRVPVARADVLAAAEEIAGLTAILRSAAPVSARDVAGARALLTDGTGPVYHSGRGLRPALARRISALQDGCWETRA